jgi:tRNA pseudouridine38-40 synthase
MSPETVRLRLNLAYDGTDFAGWAKQPGFRTVEDTLETAFALVLRMPSAPRLVVAGRTDAGVHAAGQVAHMDVPLEQLHAVAHSRTERAELDATNHPVPPALTEALCRRVNGALGRGADLVVNSISVAPDGFDARFSPLSRRYEYRIADGLDRLDPITRRTTAFSFYPLDMDAMNDAATMMLGLRDFGAFCKPRPGATTIRDLIEFSWHRNERGILIGRVEADAFCHSMVRSLVGATVAAGRGSNTLDEIVHLRDRAERTSVFTVMPARGLTLIQVIYPPDGELAARAELTRGRRELTTDTPVE